MANVSTFGVTGLNFFFQSKRAKIDGKAVSQLVKFIQGAKHSLDVAIYDMRNADVLKALKGMSTKVQLHILYDAGKAGGSSTTVDPKVSTTAQAINAAGLKAFAQPVKEKGGHLMHDKFIVRDGASVWSGSGNFTNGGLLLQDNNFFTMDSTAIAAVYSKIFGDLSSPGHTASHTTGVTNPPIKVKIKNIPVTIIFSTEVGATESIETEIQNRLKGAKKIRLMAMLVSDKGVLASLLALKKKDIKGVLDPHEMKVVMKNKDYRSGLLVRKRRSSICSGQLTRLQRYRRQERLHAQQGDDHRRQGGDHGQLQLLRERRSKRREPADFRIGCLGGSLQQVL